MMCSVVCIANVKSIVMDKKRSELLKGESASVND